MTVKPTRRCRECHEEFIPMGVQRICDACKEARRFEREMAQDELRMERESLRWDQ